MFRFFFWILYMLNQRASRGISCDGQAVRECKIKPLYGRNMERVTQMECRILEHTEYFSERAIEKIQLSKLRRILRSARNVPFWRDALAGNQAALHRDIRRMQDIRAFPVLMRDDLRSNFETGKLLNLSIPLQRRALARTSGSTGEPLAFFLDTTVIAGRRARFRRKIRWFSGGKPALTVKAMGAMQLGDRNFFGLIFFKLSNDRSANMSLADMCVFLRGLLLRSSDSVVIDTFPSNVMRLVPMLLSSRIDTSRILGFVCGGEALLPGEREYVKKMLSCDIWSYYASTEFETTGQECGQSPEHAFHVNAEYFYIEILDAEGNSLPRGKTGRVVITSLEHEAQPFIRYDTGDLGRMLEESCPCGRTLPLLVIEGRQANLIKLPNGRAFTQFHVIGHFYHGEVVSHIRQFQVVHEKPDTVVIKVVPHSPDPEEAIAFLRKRFSETFGEDINITIEVVENISMTERGKRVGYLSKF